VAQQQLALYRQLAGLLLLQFQVPLPGTAAEREREGEEVAADWRTGPHHRSEARDLLPCCLQLTATKKQSITK
jgi:hypothetical protein